MAQKKEIKKTKLTREFSAGGVVYKRVKEPESKRVKVLWLVTKSTPSARTPESIWRLPKGWLDDRKEKPGELARGERRASKEELETAALREVSEEGGIEAKIVARLATDRFFFTSEGSKVLKFVTYFLMEWIEDLPEGFGLETEAVEWLPFGEARKKLSYSSERKVLDRAKQALGK